MNTLTPRPGFTLPEVLLAVLLFAIGILGLASSATFIATQTGNARRELEAAHLAGAALDSLRAAPCAQLTAGSQSSPAGTFRWSVTTAPRTRALAAMLTYAGRVPRSHTFDALIPCEP